MRTVETINALDLEWLAPSQWREVLVRIVKDENDSENKGAGCWILQEQVAGYYNKEGVLERPGKAPGPRRTSGPHLRLKERLFRFRRLMQISALELMV